MGHRVEKYTQSGPITNETEMHLNSGNLLKMTWFKEKPFSLVLCYYLYCYYLYCLFLMLNKKNNKVNIPLSTNGILKVAEMVN
jgi:hypothetical protein